MPDLDPPRKSFHHVGLRTHDPQPGEFLVDATRVWVTNPNHHPYHVEYLRYELDSPISDEFMDAPHVAYEVDELEPHLTGKAVYLTPFEVGSPPFATVAFTREHDLFVEYMVFRPGRSWHDQ